MIKPDFKYSFRTRTIFYVSIGFISAGFDFLTFIFLSRIISPFFANPISYLVGGVSSYLLNKSYTFKSLDSNLSLKRFLIIICFGILSSQLIITFLILLFDSNNLPLIKFFAIVINALINYSGNTYFGSTHYKEKKIKK